MSQKRLMVCRQLGESMTVRCGWLLLPIPEDCHSTWQCPELAPSSPSGHINDGLNVTDSAKKTLFRPLIKILQPLGASSIKTYGPPHLQVILSRAPNNQSASTYPASEYPPSQDGDTRVPVVIRCRASSSIFYSRFPERRSTVRPSRHHHPQTSLADQRILRRPANRHAATGEPAPSNFSPRRNTAHAIRASLLASATTATF